MPLRSLAAALQAHTFMKIQEQHLAEIRDVLITANTPLYLLKRLRRKKWPGEFGQPDR